MEYVYSSSSLCSSSYDNSSVSLNSDLHLDLVLDLELYMVDDSFDFTDEFDKADDDIIIGEFSIFRHKHRPRKRQRQMRHGRHLPRNLQPTLQHMPIPLILIIRTANDATNNCKSFYLFHRCRGERTLIQPNHRIGSFWNKCLRMYSEAGISLR